MQRQVVQAAVAFAAIAGSACADDGISTDLSLVLRTLESDIADPTYHEVLATMIPTDLAAEWQRVATPDNYYLFAEQHGGAEKLASDARLNQAYERRQTIAARFLELMRKAYQAKGVKPPFDDEATLLSVLRSGAQNASRHAQSEIPIRQLPPAAGAERQWPSLGGPTQQGIVFDVEIPLEWSATHNVLWKAKLPGRGNSSPVIWGDRLLVTAESEPRPASAPLEEDDAAPDRLLLCYQIARSAKPTSETGPAGSLLWTFTAPRPKQHETLYWKNTLASSTPVTDGQRVIVFFGNAGLACCDLDGKPLWHADLGTFPTTHGPGSTPVLYQNLVIVIQDQNAGTSLCAAYDKQTGHRVWQTPRPNAMCWSTPVLFRVGQRDELIYNGSNAVIAYDPGTGDELWKAGGTSVESIPMIAAGGGRFYSASGRNGPIFALLPGGQGDVSETHVAWRHKHGGPHVPTPVYHDGLLFVVNDTGILTCYDAATGEELSQKRLRGRFSVAPLVVGDRLLLINEDGVTYIVRADRDQEILSQNDLQETILASPAVLDGRLYFRTAEHLICVGQR